MSVIIITGAGGLIGAESARFFSEKGFDIVGIDNNMRKQFFGDEASTHWNVERLSNTLPNYSHHHVDIRDSEKINAIFQKYGSSISMIIHAAAQPSHDWAARDPLTDFGINATGTLNMLEATRQFAKTASFIFTSTNKVYGDTPNRLPLTELETRWEIEKSHPYYEHGIDTSMSVDHSTHSIFGVSKVAADLMVQEYGRYFGLNTVAFRCGCLTGSDHSGTELHGFLAYLVLCVLKNKKYNIFGYKGKQVRDNIHSSDLVSMFWHYHLNPKPAMVYNAGGGRHSNCSMLEAINIAEEYCGNKLDYSYLEPNRVGDHIWWISDVTDFRKDYPEWAYQYDIRSIIKEIATGLDRRL